MATSKQQHDVPRLDTLPEEVLEQIAYFAWQIIPALRLTCRAIQEKTLHAFLREYISTRSVWASRRSLQSLEHIADSEHFSPHVRRVVISNYEWDLDAAETIWGDGEGLAEREAVEYQQFHTEYGDQIYLQQSGFMTISLAGIFRKLSKLETVFMFPGELDSPIRSYGPLDWQNAAALTTTCSGDFITRSWFILCQSIISSGWKPTHFSVGTDQDQQLRAESFMALVQPQLDLLAPAFAQLNRLDLGFQVPLEEPRKQMWNSAFLKFLRLCANVSVLCLQFGESDEDGPYYDEDEPQIPDMSDWPTFSNLRNVSLFWFHCDSGQLLGWLKEHKSTLLELTLMEFILTVEDDWRILLEEIGEQFDLDTLAVVMFEMRHGPIEMVEAKRPQILQAIEDRTRDGIFCPKCARKAGVRSMSSDEEADDSEVGMELGSDLESYSDDEDEWEDEDEEDDDDDDE